MVHFHIFLHCCIYLMATIIYFKTQEMNLSWEVVIRLTVLITFK